MINLIFQTAKANDPDKVMVDSRFFFDSRIAIDDKNLEDEYVRKIIGGVDGATVEDGCKLRSYDGKVIPPQWLSTGTKTAICVYLYPDLIFNATQMGDNAFRFVAELCRHKDRTVLTYRDLPYSELKSMDVQKDYQPVEFKDDEDFWDRFSEWKEEMYND